MKRKGLLIALGTVLVGLLSFFVLSKTVFAGQWVPDTSINGGNWSNIYLELSKSDGLPANVSGNTLDINQAYVKLSYDGAAGNRFRIYDFCMDSASNIDYGTGGSGHATGGCGGGNLTMVQICALNSIENADQSKCTPPISTCPYGCVASNDWTPYIDIKDSNGNFIQPEKSSFNGKYNYYAKLYFLNDAAVPPGNINAFRVEASGGIAGFMSNERILGGSGYQMAVQNRNKSQNYGGTNHEDNMDFNFKIACNSSSSSFNLRWKDADTDTYDPNITWYIRNERTGQQLDAINLAWNKYKNDYGGVFNVQNRDAALRRFMGGNGEEDSYLVTSSEFPFKQGDVIRWGWQNVQANNGVVMWMPFDDAVNSPGSCPMVGTLDTATCNGDGLVSGWAVDTADWSRKVTIRVRAGSNGTQGSSNPLVAEFPADVARPGESYAGISINGHGFSQSTLNQVPGNPKVSDYIAQKGGGIYFFVYAVDPSDSTRTVQLTGSPKFASCGCSAVQLSVAGQPQEVIEGGQAFSITAGYADTSGPPYSNVVFNVVQGEYTSALPGNVPSVGGTPITVAGNGTRAGTVNNITISTLGTYTARVRFTLPDSSTILCNRVFKVANKPYMRVYGNDVSVGGEFGTENCSLSDDHRKAAILAFARNYNTDKWAGAGSQLANTALGQIEGYISAANQSPSRASPESTPPKGLTIGNYYDPDSVYGGESGISRCIPDYFSIVKAQLGEGGPGGAGNIINTEQGSYKPTTRLTIQGGTVSTKTVILVEGDAFITHDITFPASYSTSNPPSLYVIVKGNIYISKNVTKLAGVYIAQPLDNGSKGEIFTCGNTASGLPFSITVLGNQCNSPLTIDGAFIAQTVRFLRTNGTLNNSTENEAASSSNIAEVFKSSGNLYMTAPDVLKKPTTTTRKYDSITSLPPVL